MTLEAPTGLVSDEQLFLAYEARSIEARKRYSIRRTRATDVKRGMTTLIVICVALSGNKILRAQITVCYLGSWINGGERRLEAFHACNYAYNL